jgi:hypothetical protein
MRKTCLVLLLVGCSPEAPPLDPPETGITYHQDVAPILANHCVSCHQAGSIAGSIPLDTYEQVSALAPAIMDAVRSKRMPPSVVDVSGDCNEYRDARRLDPDEMAALLEWGNGDRRAGTPAIVEPKQVRHLDRVDLTLTMAEPYTPDASRPDDYRCFVIDPMTDRDRFVTGYEVRPGEPRTVHHVLLFSLANEESDREATALDAADPTPGYECFGGPGAGDFRFLAGWAPGTGATIFPANTGLLLPAGRKTVLQVHYNLMEAGEPDQTAVELSLRDTVLDEAIVLPLANLDLELQPGQRNAETSLEVILGENDAYGILGTFPHMHRLGRSLRVEKNGACLVDVPQWSFEWQEFFFYAEEIRTLPNDRVRLTCTYDTTSRTETVTWGEGTDDEMCLAGFYVVKR